MYKLNSHFSFHYCPMFMSVNDLFQDPLLAEILQSNRHCVVSFHEHDSLLENQVDQNLTEEEKKAAWEEYENEKKGIIVRGETSLDKKCQVSTTILFLNNFVLACLFKYNCQSNSNNPSYVQALVWREQPAGH